MNVASEEGVKQAAFHFSLYTEPLVKPSHVDMWLIIVQCHGMSLSQSECLWGGWEAGIWEMRCSCRVGMYCFSSSITWCLNRWIVHSAASGILKVRWICVFVFWSNAVGSPLWGASCCVLCADAVYTSPKSERLDHVTTDQVLSDSPKLKNSPSEFLLGVQYVMGASGANTWIGGIWHQGGNTFSWASYYLAGFILQPKCLWHHGDILKTLILTLSNSSLKVQEQALCWWPQTRVLSTQIINNSLYELQIPPCC